jgi:hypothetical protein
LVWLIPPHDPSDVQDALETIDEYNLAESARLTVTNRLQYPIQPT